MHRQRIARIYLDTLKDTPNLTLPGSAAGTESVWHLFVVRHDRRDALREELEQQGVQAALHYPIPNHKSGAFAEEYGHMSFPETEEICRTCLSLPIGPHMPLTAAAEIATIVDRVVRKL
jgi:dTDP-4-amino-4,6-dideoxygalactose transaminase